MPAFPAVQPRYMAKERVGLIGPGNMGAGIARYIARAGTPLVVWAVDFTLLYSAFDELIRRPIG